MSVKRKLSLPALLLSVATLLAACTPDSGKVEAERTVPDAKVIVARVNGEPVYEDDVLRRMRAARGGAIEEVKADSNRWQMLLDVATQAEVMDELLLQAAVADGMTVSAAEARGFLDRTREMAGDRAFGEMLEERGASEEVFRDFLVERELISRYKDKLVGGISVGEGELQEYYEGHSETFAEPIQVRLEVFTFGGREAAEKIHDRWKDGENFDKIAEAYLEEGERVGRRTRWMPIDAAPDELGAKVAAADAGTILDPLRVEDRFYVVRVIERKEARTRGFDEVKEEIREKILDIRRSRALDEWYSVSSREAKIEYVR